ncbi:MAG: FAD-binding oxidoreductase [Rhizobiales bacterium]|nr:FAD-binding oxidoreductase [Hyphomicrobiales bacterium]
MSVEQKYDVIVLGAGIAGVSAANHLLRKGKRVALVDRRQAGEETSHGNLGVIERDGFVPITFPTNLSSILKYALNRETEMHFHLGALIKMLPWLWSLKKASSPEQVRKFAETISVVEGKAVEAHRELARAAGAEHFFRDTGWVRFFRTEKSFAELKEHLEFSDTYGAPYEIMTAQELREIEPHIAPVFHRAIWWKDTQSVSSPGNVTKAYAALFSNSGGEFLIGNAASLKQGADDAWSVETEAGQISANDVVVALGPWSMDLLKPLGYSFPFAIKRGYHQHFAPRGNQTLSRPIVDSDFGYAVSPMDQGIRLTTGIEFADREAPPSPVQLQRATKIARDVFPLGEVVEDEPWKGQRPCFPDSLPIVGPAPRHKGLWLDFGHGHVGFTIGPITGQLMAEMVCGEEPFTDPSPYSANRF